MFSNGCRTFWLLAARLRFAALLVAIVALTFLLPSLKSSVDLAETRGIVELPQDRHQDAPVALNAPSGKSDFPSIVTIDGRGFDYTYYVNGSMETIRGVGYNPIYRYHSDEERAAFYDRDFAMMRAAGINTIVGWDQDRGYSHDKFDDLLLTKAHQFGLGVIIPFHLPPSGDYTDPEFKARIAGDVVDWVQRNKAYPAIRMWGIGNEVLLDISSAEQAREFAEFLVELADLTHRLDPNHPVVYRETEDVYLPILWEAITRDGVHRPWFVYGLHVYTYRLSQILADWTSHNLDMPVVVTEFAPIGLRGQERARGYVKMWEMLRGYPLMVLGGLAYVWTVDGPEPVDRDFGLTNGVGIPVDDSFAMLGNAYLRGSLRPPSRLANRPL